MKPGGNFNSSQWDFNKVEKSKLTPEQINYAVELYFWRTKDPEMKKQFELWSNYQQNTNASLKADPISDIAAASELPEVTITMAKPNYIDLIKSDIRNKWTNMYTEDLFDRVRHVLEPTEHFKDIELSEGMLGFGHNLTPSIVSGDEPTIVSQRIASLFPHPETANGQWFIRSFDDPRVNFKQGGKLNYLNLMN